MQDVPLGPNSGTMGPNSRSTSHTDMHAHSRSSGVHTVDLEWQSFPKASTSSSGAATAAPAFAPPGVPAATAAPGLSAASAPTDTHAPEASFTVLSCFSPAFYTTVFDVDTQEVVKRTRAGLWPFSGGSFVQSLGGKPDLYGPVWMCATLVFAMGAAANMARGAGNHDFRLLTLALCYIYGFVLGMPVLLWLGLNYVGVSRLGLVSCMCMYGYALTPFVPAAVLCAFPSAGLQWVLMLGSGCLAALHVYKGMAPYIHDESPVPAGRSMLLLAVGSQLAFAIVLKYVFF